MLDLYKMYSEAILISVSKKRKNKYGLFHIHFTGINNFGRIITFAVGFLNIKCTNGYEWLFKQFVDKI